MSEDNLTPAALEAAGALGGSPDPGYTWPIEPEVRANLEAWRDMNFGVIIHWGIYSAIGQGGSWSLHRDDLGWFTDPPADWNGTDAAYQDWYYDQARTFVGEEFDASEWAMLCADAGMRYCVFTTKHHDGFCMYDSHYTNLKSTSESSGLRRDVLREVCDAFREEGLTMGAYFSLADWSRTEYWDRALPIHDRFHNYDIAARPRAWERFKDFTRDQLEEVVEGYGPFNMVWLDAGWVREPHEPIGMEKIAATLRAHDPGLMIVHREVHGPFENYRTPEQEIPDDILHYPWESCMTLQREWCAMSRDEASKPVEEIVANLVRIVARGGNYLLGIGPDATGHMPDSVRDSLERIGTWMSACGEGVYGTRVPEDPPQVESLDGAISWYLTEKPQEAGTALYAFGIPAEGRELDATSLRVDRPVGAVTLLGSDGRSLALDESSGRIEVPASPTQGAVGLRIELA